MQVAGGDCFVSLFCGSCAVESKVQGFSRKLLNDRHEYLIAMLQGVQQGYNLPEHITLEQYRYIRENKDADPVLAGFVGFGCSFGGKWFGGYARNKTGTNYAEQSKRSLLKDMATLQDAQFVCGDYRRLCIPPNSVIYADPPYNGTVGPDRCAPPGFFLSGHVMFGNLGEAKKYLGQAAKMLIGIPDYDNYVEHMKTNHPDKPYMTYTEFFRERQEARYGGSGEGGVRCC